MENLSARSIEVFVPVPARAKQSDFARGSTAVNIEINHSDNRRLKVAGRRERERS